nr:hypothetical protein [Catenovulum agarivorans]
MFWRKRLSSGNTCVLLILSCLCLAKGSFAQEPEQQSIYLSVGVGLSETQITDSELSSAYQNVTLDTLSVDKKGTSYQLALGYQFHPNFAFELAYQDLGKRELSFTGLTDDLDAFHQKVNPVYVDTGRGTLASFVAQYPIFKRTFVSAKLGLFDWKHQFSLTNSTSQTLSVEQAGTDLHYALELSHQLGDSAVLYTQIGQFQLPRHSITNLSIGFKYQFNVNSLWHYPITHRTSPPIDPVSVKEIPTKETVEPTAIPPQKNQANSLVKPSNYTTIKAPVSTQQSIHNSPVVKSEQLEFPDLKFSYLANAYLLNTDKKNKLNELGDYLLSHQQAHVDICILQSDKDSQALKHRAGYWRAFKVSEYLVGLSLSRHRINVCSTPAEILSTEAGLRISVTHQPVLEQPLFISEISFKAYSDWLSGLGKQKLAKEADDSIKHVFFESTIVNRGSLIGAIELAVKRVEVTAAYFRQVYPDVKVSFNYQVVTKDEVEDFGLTSIESVKLYKLI